MTNAEAVAASKRSDLLRTRDGDQAQVGFAELFYDLVFVFAVTQLSHSLIEHPTPLGFVQTGMLFLALWWTWIYTTWATNWLDPETVVVRLLLFALMAAGLVLSTSIPRAFGDRGAIFGVAIAGIQVGRSLFVALVMRRPNPAHAHNFFQIAVWSAASALFWIAGGLAEPEQRLPLWLVALGIEYLAPVMGFRVPGLGRATTDEWNVEGSHMAERCGLFIIIALGESILVTGATFAETRWAAAEILAFASALTGSIAMWWIYFNIGAERASEKITRSDNPGKHARVGYTYLHVPIVGGIIVTAASDEMVLGHPLGKTDMLSAMCLIAGPALYILGTIAFKRATGGWWPRSHFVGLGLFALLALVAGRLDPLLLSIGSSLVLVMIALWETLSIGGSAPQGPEIGYD